MKTVALQQVSNKYARENAGRTLEKAIGLGFIKKYLPEPLFKELEVACPDGKIYVWGAKSERQHQTYKMLSRNSLVLFRRGPKIYKYGVVIGTTRNDALAESLWGRDADGEMWPNIFFFAHITDKNISAARINRALGRNVEDHWQGLVVLTLPDSERLREFFISQVAGL
jgi:hypothetical protein